MSVLAVHPFLNQVVLYWICRVTLIFLRTPVVDAVMIAKLVQANAKILKSFVQIMNLRFVFTGEVDPID